MVKAEYPRWLGILGIAAWLSVLYFLFPLPSQRFVEVPPSDPVAGIEKLREEEKRLGVAPGELARLIREDSARKATSLWIRWWLVVAGIVMGIAAGIHAYRRGAHWPYFTGLTSAIYLVAWVLAMRSLQLPSHSGILDAYIANLTYTVSGSSFLGVIVAVHRDVVLPLVHVFIVSFVIYLRPSVNSKALDIGP
ncbi:MAG: hypothetical protein ACREYF_00175 [Gammaproteobacteria bacterium]